MNLFSELSKNQRKTPFLSSSEALFFKDNAFRLNGNDLWNLYLKPSDSFMTIRANIIIRSLLNKTSIEKLYSEKTSAATNASLADSLSVADYMAEGMSEMPYLLFHDHKIYVPFFPISINDLYSTHFEKLLKAPYKRLIGSYQSSAIDIFDYYGYEIYDSYFTKLVPIRKTPKCLAAYDYDAEALYFINDQGRLDEKICFFDKTIKIPVKTHLVKRIEAVADAYLADDKDALCRALVGGNLISSGLMHKLAGQSLRYEEKEKKEGEL